MLKEDEGSVFYQRIGIATRADWELITFSAAEDLVKATFDSYFQSNTLLGLTQMRRLKLKLCFSS